MEFSEGTDNTKASSGVLIGLEKHQGHEGQTGREATMDASVKLCWGHED